MPSAAATKLATKKLFGPISLKISLFVSVGLELAFSVLILITAYKDGVWNEFKLQVLLQSVGVVISAGVYYGVYVGETRWILLYIIYSIFDIACMFLYSWPAYFGDLESRAIGNVVSYIEEGGNSTACIVEALERAERDIQKGKFYYYGLFFAALSVSIALVALAVAAYREANRSAVGAVEYFNPLDEESGDTLQMDRSEE